MIVRLFIFKSQIVEVSGLVVAFTLEIGEHDLAVPQPPRYVFQSASVLERLFAFRKD